MERTSYSPCRRRILVRVCTKTIGIASLYTTMGFRSMIPPAHTSGRQDARSRGGVKVPAPPPTQMRTDSILNKNRYVCSVVQSVTASFNAPRHPPSAAPHRRNLPARRTSRPRGTFSPPSSSAVPQDERFRHCSPRRRNHRLRPDMDLPKKEKYGVRFE